MPEFLKSAVLAGSSNWLDVSIRLVFAVLLGLGVAGVYRATRPKAQVTPSFTVTLVLLSVLIAMVTQVIGDNVALAFSLVGALSIVRFRTVVRDTEDTAFVIFAVAVGMAVGAQNLVVAFSGLVIVGLTVFLVRPRRSAPGPDESQFLVTVRVGLGHDANTLLAPVLDAHLMRRQLVSIATVKQNTSIEVAYAGTFGVDKRPESLVRDLNRLDGVHGVDLTRRSPAADQDPWW